MDVSEINILDSDTENIQISFDMMPKDRLLFLRGAVESFLVAAGAEQNNFAKSRLLFISQQLEVLERDVFDEE